MVSGKSTEFQCALSGYAGLIEYHTPSHKSLKLSSEVSIVKRSLCSPTPLQGITAFTDGPGEPGKAVVVWKGHNS